MADDEAWDVQLAAEVGRRVKRLRQSPGLRLSAQQVADRTQALGHEVKRSVIANLESGRRGTVTLADVLVLARALSAPPIALIADFGGVNDVLPGTRLSGPDALRWILGESDGVVPDVPGLEPQADFDAYAAAALPYVLHREIARVRADIKAHHRAADDYQGRARATPSQSERERYQTLALQETERAVRAETDIVRLNRQLAVFSLPRPDDAEQ